ncbi:MAG: GNAT family N-acetyltransferase [Chloroflexi bacterium]|nr:GNAT family N-acetyltransferase [Chloroflexota bacterium]
MSHKASITLREATRADESFLLELYGSTRQNELAAVPWDDLQKADFIQMQFNAQRTDYLRRFPGAELSIVVVDGRDVGRTWVNRGAGEIRLLDIALLPEFRAKGVGTTLLLRLQSEAKERGLPLRHSVHKTNPGAISGRPICP